MLRAAIARASSSLRQGYTRFTTVTTASPSGLTATSGEPFKGMEEYVVVSEMVIEGLKHEHCDGYHMRHLFNQMAEFGVIPNSEIIKAFLLSARKNNDYAAAVRFLEYLKWQFNKDKDTYNKLMEEVKPLMSELGISTVEEMGFDKPEFYYESVFDMKPPTKEKTF